LPPLTFLADFILIISDVPKQTKIWKNAFLGVFTNFLGVKRAKTPAFDRENALFLNSRRKARFNGQKLEFSLF